MPQALVPDTVNVHQYMTRTSNPITVITVNKMKNAHEYFDELISLSTNMRIVVFVDDTNNDIYNAYMLVWRVTNNIDALRDIYISGLMVGVDGTNKNALDGFTREWPDDVKCTQEVVESLKKRDIWDLEDTIEKQYQL